LSRKKIVIVAPAAEPGMAAERRSAGNPFSGPPA